MAVAKKSLDSKIFEKLIFIYLAIFPLGQLIRIDTQVFGINITIHPTDLVVGVSLVLFILGFIKKTGLFNQIASFLAVASFSLIFSLTFFGLENVFVGSLYLLRLFGYSTLFLLAWNIAVKKKQKKSLFSSLILVSLFTGIFGWIQYFWYSDLRFLKLLGWDDHHFRLVGTFLDPGFTSIILVLGFLATFVSFVSRKDKKVIPILVFFLVTIAFTYARAAYLALFAGLFVVFRLKRGIKRFFWIVFAFLILIFLLPRPAGEGVKLERLHSVYDKIENYSQTIEIIKKHPLFGVGFNNICAARVRYLGDLGDGSHSCSGSDSSLLFVLATTGVVGLLIYLNLATQLLGSLSRDTFGKAFLACSVALFVHSFFVNSLFYPWIMGWMAILLALAVKSTRLKG